MPFGRTWSKAEMRSVATIRSLSSPSSYVSRTLPFANSLSGRSVPTTGGPAITDGDLGERFGAQVVEMLGAAEQRSEGIYRCGSGGAGVAGSEGAARPGGERIGRGGREDGRPQRRRSAAWAPKIRRGAPA